MSFIRKDCLEKHLSTHKVDKLTNSSSYCENKFIQKINRIGQEMVHTGEIASNLTERNKENEEVKSIDEKLSDDNDLCRKSVIKNRQSVETDQRLGDDDNWQEDSDKMILPYESSWSHEEVDIGEGHPPDGSTKCRVRLAEESNLVDHERSDSKDKSMNYSWREKSFIRKDHLVSYERKRNRPFKCSYCEKNYTCKSHLDSHERIHTGERPFKCYYCEMRFIRKDHLVKHMKKIHTGETPFKCYFCEMSFKHKDYLVKHIENHTGERPFKCYYCEMSFGHKHRLERHGRIHSSERPFKCCYCEMSFIRKDHLKRHERIHTGERAFKCSFCEMSFVRKDYLEKHFSTHKVDKPFNSSSNLEENFTRKDHVVRHKRMNKKPFKCSYCEKNFILKDKLVTHLRIHTVNTSFKCTFCDETFSEMGDLVKHEIIHSGHGLSNLAEENKEKEELGDDEDDLCEI